MRNPRAISLSNSKAFSISLGVLVGQLKKVNARINSLCAQVAEMHFLSQNQVRNIDEAKRQLEKAEELVETALAGIDSISSQVSTMGE